MEKEKRMMERDKPTFSLSPMLVDMEKMFERFEEITREISDRAFGFFEERGRALGSPIDDWMRAESEVLRKVPVEIKETDDEISVCMALAGFSPDEIEVSVKDTQLFVTGRAGSELKGSDESTIYSEWRGTRFYRELPLPSRVKDGSLTTDFKDGVLMLSMKKATAGKEQAVAKTV
ncbi:MAG TPA: Hsp20/alpha crystallin family protein [Pyrinomonadaceae bacterium]|nr:Hsp20/alpha crystallin family protein [Pyrinomonadaceae bacterium]HMP64661.1 Hsp20/alpha crystallin family protein [Pyrinomonadaceae bacterium]